MSEPASHENLLLYRLAQNLPTICLPLRISRSPHVIHMARQAGFDAIYVDMEHSSVSVEATAELALAAASVGLTPLVRIPSHDPYYIGRVLEGGAQGIIAPHVENAADAAAIVDHCRFPPYGKRAMAGVSVALGYDTLTADAAGRRLDARTAVIVMLESMTAIGNADSISAVPGVDILLVGTGDLTEELGIHGQHDHPQVRAAYELVGAACRKHGRYLGVAGIKGVPETLQRLYHQGARFFSAKNPASADQVRRMMQQVAKLDAQAKPSLIQTTAWVYQTGAGNSVRFDVGLEDGKVRRIFTSSCNAK